MDNTLRDAITRRDALRRELEAWEAFINAYSAQLQRDRTEQIAHATQADLFADSKPTRAERAVAVRAMIDEVERIIIDEGRPMTRSKLLEGLGKLGISVDGTDKSKVLGTNLWRSLRFHNIEGAGYWPVSKPIPSPFDLMPRRTTSLS